MAKQRRYLNLAGATQARMIHDKDTTLANVEELKNFVPGIDGCPALRDDLTYETERVMSVINAGAGGLVASVTDDHLCAITESRSGELCWWSRFFAFQTTGGTATIKNGTYTTGTVSGTIGTSTLNGSGTEWLTNAHPGALVVIQGDTYVYRVSAVADDTTITLDGNLTDNVGAGSTYTLYQTHNGVHAQYPLNIQQWGNFMVYNSEKPEPFVVPGDISGPFINTTAQGSLYKDWEGIGVTDAVIFGNGYWVRATVATGLFYASDPTGTWTAATGDPGGLATGIYSTHATHFIATFGQGVYEDSDGTGATWTTRTSTGKGIVSLAEDGAGQYVGVTGSTATIYYSSDLTGAWSTATGVSNLYSVTHNGTNYVAVGALGKVTTSANGSTWTTRSSGISEGLSAVATDSSTVVVAVGRNNTAIYSEDDGVTWSEANTPNLPDANWVSVRWSGTYFLAAGQEQGATTRGRLMKSTDGIDWTEVSTGTLSEPGHVFYDAVPSNAAMDNLLVLRSNYGGGIYGYWGETFSDTGAEFGDFSPLSDIYRSKTFTVAGSFIMLGGMSEWNDDTTSWVYHPRRWRWPSPGTHNDWEGEGAGFLDIHGIGDILCARTTGNSVLMFDATGAGVLEQTDDLDNPWGYRRLRDGIRPISNLLSMGNQIFWVGHDGRLWQSNGIQVGPFSSFDLSEFDDWEALGGKPIWLAWYPALNSMMVFKRTNAGTDHRIWIISEDGRVSYMSLPVWTDVDATETRRPLSICISQEGAMRLYVGYDADSTNDTNHLVSLYLNKGSYIKGSDTIQSGMTSRWWGELQTGYERLSNEGHLVTVNSVEIYGYAGYTGRTNESSSLEPTIGVQIKDQNSSVWFSASDNVGTATIGTADLTGSGTAWSNLIAAGDDVSVAFTLPCLATQARVYLDTTLQVLGTDYTITDTKEITLSSALPSGTDLYVYWDAYPYVQMEVGDLILGTSTVHKVATIPTATTGTLDSYLSTGTDTGTHVPGEIMEADEGSTVHGVAKRVDPVRLKLIVLPQNNASAPSSVRLSGLLIEYTSTEAEEKRKD